MTDSVDVSVAKMIREEEAYLEVCTGIKSYSIKEVAAFVEEVETETVEWTDKSIKLWRAIVTQFRFHLRRTWRDWQ